MPEYCTCGTKLVEDARFCHRCGRPTSEQSAMEALAVEEAPPPVPASTQPSLQAKLSQVPVSFSNPIALRVAFLMSLAVIPVELTPVLNALLIVWWLAAGWCAVLLYRKLTGSVLSIRAGARLGSITGVLTFLSLTIGFTATILLTGKQFFDQLEQTVKQNPDVAQVMHDPTMMFVFLLLCLAILGALVVGTCAAGGALGARFTARKAGG
jgi:hypothetical protein